MTTELIKRKAARRNSAQYCISAEKHMENEVKHERLLTDTSRLSSSWASLNVSDSEQITGDCSSSSASANNSPTRRPHSFSGPLVISVTCSSSSSPIIHGCSTSQLLCNGRARPLSPVPTSPVASPVSSRVQCYSPGLAAATNSPTARRTTTGGASPLLLTTALCRKRSHLSSFLPGSGSSGDVSRECSPDPSPCSRANKCMRQGDLLGNNLSAFRNFRWPPCPPLLLNPPSPSCQLFPALTNSSNSVSPSTSSLPSPRLSLSSAATGPPSPVSGTSTSAVSSMNINEAARTKNDGTLFDTEPSHLFENTSMKLDTKGGAE